MLPIAAWLHGESSRQSRGGERQPVPATHQAIPVRGMGSLLAGAGSPFLRWVARKPDLSPADASRAARFFMRLLFIAVIFFCRVSA